MPTYRQMLRLSVCLLACLASLVTSSDIFFTSNPSTVRPLETRKLTLRCSLRDSDIRSDNTQSDVTFVHSLAISKADEELATVAEHLGPTVFDNTSGVEVTGQVSGTGHEKGYLQVSWTFPDSRQGDAYMCRVRGMDKHGHLRSLSNSLVVSVNELLMNDVVRYINDIVNDKQNDIQAAVSANKSELKTLKFQINNLNATNSALQAQVDELKTKQDTTVVFMALIGSDISLSNGDVVVFTKVQINIGGGYNLSTGVFTSPNTGYYKFDIHLLGQKDKEFYVCIKYRGKCVAKAYVDDEFGWQSASNSVSLLLQRGDTVRVVVNGEPTSHLYSDLYTTFSGQLLALA